MGFFPIIKQKVKERLAFTPSQDFDNMDRFPHQKMENPVIIVHIYKAIEHCDVVTHKKLI
jgi:hypothetical protein